MRDAIINVIAWALEHPEEEVASSVMQIVREVDGLIVAGHARVKKPECKPPPALEEVSHEEWERNRECLEAHEACPCDGHPAENCETCRGACSCHYKGG